MIFEPQIPVKEPIEERHDVIIMREEIDALRAKVREMTQTILKLREANREMKVISP